MRKDWEEQADFMRSTGATRATWTADGQLVSLELGPPPPVRNTQHQRSSSQKGELRELPRSVPGLTKIDAGSDAE